MKEWLEIIIPVSGYGSALDATMDSLAAQTSREFGVVLSEQPSPGGRSQLEPAAQLLADAGIAVRRVRPRRRLGRIEHLNWAHAQAEAEWLKPLFAGQRLEPQYVAKMRERVEASPKAQFARCDVRVQEDWGVRLVRAPFAESALTPLDFLRHMLDQMDWIGRSTEMMYRRLAWRALGGYSVNLPAGAALNLNVSLGLHHGIENVAECLASRESVRPPAGALRRGKFSAWLEMWIILRQARNYCSNAKLEWPVKGTGRAWWSQMLHTSRDSWFDPVDHD
jgi:hypothetical protein